MPGDVDTKSDQQVPPGSNGNVIFPLYGVFLHTAVVRCTGREAKEQEEFLGDGWIKLILRCGDESPQSVGTTNAAPQSGHSR